MRTWLDKLAEDVRLFGKKATISDPYLYGTKTLQVKAVKWTPCWYVDVNLFDVRTGQHIFTHCEIFASATPEGAVFNAYEWCDENEVEVYENEPASN